MKERTAFALFSAGVIAVTLMTGVVLSLLEASSQQAAVACVALICVTASAAANLVIHYYNR
jgi:hypothetical protein